MLRSVSLAIIPIMFSQTLSAQNAISLTLQSQMPLQAKDEFATVAHEEKWLANETAIIVCDVWNYHHCLNAVRRLEEFAPRLDAVLKDARERGVTIIHSPSDCMPAYVDHPARKRAEETPAAEFQPAAVADWCSTIPAEEQAVYPIDQSDGGEDDAPREHAEWAAKLKALGLNPGTPWTKQSPMISIDSEKDFISDRGDEVWNILEHQGIKNVILTGVHTNMCVLGRPFGLRQMARNGKHVVLMRDMTDTMYNPNRWPYVSHHEGTRRVIAHIERFVCPTITSDQFLGGEPFQISEKNNTHPIVDAEGENPRSTWTRIRLPYDEPIEINEGESLWLRCVIRIPKDWTTQSMTLRCQVPSSIQLAWCNGEPLAAIGTGPYLLFGLHPDAIAPNDANLIVLKLKNGNSLDSIPVFSAGNRELPLNGIWQMRIGNDENFANMPLPAKFGAGADIVFSPELPLWTPQAVTRVGEFTPGIEGPACDRSGNIFAVNYREQGTIGKVRPDGHAEVLVKLPGESIGNGIRFDDHGDFFVADYTQHNILKVNARTRKVEVFAHHDEMSQPNDIAMAPDGTLYASDPNWPSGTGQLWRIDRDGTVTRLAEKMGTTNGIEVSPDGSKLYVNESKQRNIWAFTIDKQKNLTNKKLLRKFDDFGFDGMRCDVDGNLYVTRYGKGTVVKLASSGEILKEIPVLGAKPSNICFGGPDGRTAYVTEVEFTRLVSFRVDRPGRSWKERSR